MAGTFNHWGEPISLRKKSDGTFELLVQLGEGRYEYKFMVDGQWKHDPTQLLSRSTLGSVNNFFKVSMENTSSGVAKRKKKSGFKRGHKREHSNFSIDLDLTLEQLGNFGRNTPPGDYGTHIPDFVRLYLCFFLCCPQVYFRSNVV